MATRFYIERTKVRTDGSDIDHDAVEKYSLSTALATYYQEVSDACTAVANNSYAQIAVALRNSDLSTREHEVITPDMVVAES